MKRKTADDPAQSVLSVTVDAETQRITKELAQALKHFNGALTAARERGLYVEIQEGNPPESSIEFKGPKILRLRVSRNVLLLSDGR